MTNKHSDNQTENHNYFRCDIPYFTTYDLGLAAALACLNYELVDLDKENPRKVKFIFSHSSDLDQAVKDYFSGKLTVSARSMFENSKMLKNRIYSSV